MKTYTLDDIIEDVKNYEGVVIGFTDDSPLRRLFYYKKYSEYYDEPLGDNKTVDTLKFRVNEFLQNSYLPSLDKLPEDREKRTLFFYAGNEEKVTEYRDANIASVMFKFQKEVQVDNLAEFDLNKVLGDFIDNWDWSCYYDNEVKRFYMFERKKH